MSDIVKPVDSRIRYLSPTLITLPMGANVQLSKSFNSSEFEDITCAYLLVDLQLVTMLQRLRDHLMVPIKVTSGFRSFKKQEALRLQGYETAKGMSTHEVGCAADINCYGRFDGEAMEKAARAVGFKSVGVAKSWIHVDIRMDEEFRQWRYR